METSSKANHIGRKISRLRELKGFKQEYLAQELGVSQQSISKIEQSETIENEVLEKVAKALGFPAEAIKNFDEEKVIYNIQNNYDNASNNVNYSFNPIDKLIEAYEENKKLYERLLQAEREKNEILKDK